ncbi:transglutaminase-like domain-containing protein [Brassicibacter mesophilus]|uniref:transglutaminase-like domain-containing protein n=1 Tax=Brassicibacter mesophilus TaxID=745119 RepID=UPI003D255643
MKLDSLLQYYSEQGLITSPCSYHYLLAELPTDIPKLCECIHKITLIDLLATMELVSIPKEHSNDNNIRRVEEKLGKIAHRDNSSILNSRSYEKLLLGNCRDLSLIMCSVLRNHKIPARVRSGFATFFDPFQKKYFDHWVCEYWDKSEKRWIKVDPWMSQIQYRKELLPIELFKGLLELNYNPYDVKNEFFITGGEAWINCRKKGHNADNYGTYGDLLKGNWFVRDNMIRDLLCLNKLEPLPWDCWGIMGRENSDIKDRELAFLDEIAEFLVYGDLTQNTLSDKLESLQIEKCIMESLV